ARRAGGDVPKGRGVGRALFSFALPVAGAQLLQAAAGVPALLLLGGMGADALSAAATPVVLVVLAGALFAPCAAALRAAIPKADAAHDETRVRTLIARRVRTGLILGVR